MSKVIKLFRRIKKYPLKNSLRAVIFLPKVLSKVEKIIVLVSLGLIILSGALILYQSWISSTKLVPSTGGIFREGIVGDTKDIDKHIIRLTNAGLTKYDANQNIVGDMADSWKVNDGGKAYEFHLRPEFNSDALAQEIINQNVWKDIDVATPDPQVITFSFKQPFSPFLYTSTQPIFADGPYKVTKVSKDEVELTAKDEYYQGRPNIDKIIVRAYSSQDELEKAAKTGQVQGFSSEKDEAPLNNFNKFEMKLNRDLDVFFNLNNKDLQDVNVRKALKESTPVSKPLTLRLVTSDTAKNQMFAQKLADSWTKNGVKVNLEIKDNITMQKTVIPKRDYDVLLYGLDYGSDPDPYAFWHSSQITEGGKNLSNFKNTQADKLLEAARLELDPNKRASDYNEFQKILDSEIPMFVVEHQNYYYQAADKVFGIQNIVGTSESDTFMNVFSWYMETKRIKA